MHGTDHRYLPQLDGLRAVAVSLVVVYHVVQLGHGPVLRGGFLGVDVFFVLSGFLITTLLLREQAATGRVALLAFYRRRLWRLWPGLLLASAGLAAWFTLVPSSWVPTPSTADDTLVGAAYALTHVSGWVVSLGGSAGYLGHTWSLSVEEHFYLVWPAVLLVLLRRGSARLPLQVLALTLVANTWPLVLWLLGGAPLRLYASPDGRAGQLMVGCLLAVLLTEPGWRARLSGLCRGPLLVAALVFLALAVLGLRRQHLVYLVGGQLAIALATTVVLTHLVLHDGRLSRRLSVRPAVLVGQWSYGIYLWHGGTIIVPYALLGPGLGGRVVGAALAVVLAAASLRWVERPLLQRYGRRREVVADVPAQGGPQEAVEAARDVRA